MENKLIMRRLQNDLLKLDSDFTEFDSIFFFSEFIFFFLCFAKALHESDVLFVPLCGLITCPDMGKKVFKGAVALTSILILIQLFPPVLVLDSTSLRHFLIALFDLAATVTILFWCFKYGEKTFFRQVMLSPLSIVWGILVIFMGLSITWSINPTEGIVTWNRWIVVFTGMILSCILIAKENKSFKALVICTLTIATINVLACIVCYYVFDVHISQRNNLKLNGFYGNKNIFAVAMLFKLPFLYYAFIRYRRFVKWYSLALIFLVCFCLVILSTRSSFIGLALQLIILAAYGIYSWFRFKNRTFVKLSLIAAVAIVGFIIGDLFIEYNFNHFSKIKTNNYTIDARIGSIAEGNSKGRLVIWKNTSEIIKQSPWTGYGVGNHKLAIMKVECAKKADYIVSDHAHNDFLEMFSELGIFGFLLYVTTYVVSAIMCIRQILTSKHEVHRLIALVAACLLVTYMNDAMFNFPLERADCQIYLIIGVALVIANQLKINRRTDKADRMSDKVALAFLFVLMLPVTFVEGTHCYSSVLQKKRILQHNGDKDITYSPEDWLRLMPAMPNIDESTKPIAVNVAERFAERKRYREAIDILLKDNSNPYYSLREFRLSSYYNQLDKRDSAVLWAKRCIRMKPLCYSPVRVLVSVSGKEGKADEQLRLINEYLDKYQLEPLAWEDKVTVLLRQGKRDEALTTVKKASEYMPHNGKIKALEEKILSGESRKTNN